VAQTIAICNQKGGVAKTTTCISLGACFAEKGYSTLLVDLDPQANLSLAAGLKPENQESTNLADLLIEIEESGAIEPDAYEGIEKTIHPCLDVLPTDSSLALIEHDLYQRAGYENLLKNLLAPWEEKYQYILIDCLPSLGSLTIMALTAAQRVLIPVQCEYLSAWGVMKLVETIDAVREHTNPGLDYSLLVTLFDQRNRISREVYERLREKFKDHLLENVIGLDTRLRESVVNGEPVIQYAPKTRASLQYRGLAQEWMQRYPFGGN